MNMQSLKLYSGHPQWWRMMWKEHIVRKMHLRWRYWVEQNSCNAPPHIVSLRVTPPELSETLICGQFGSFGPRPEKEIKKDPEAYMPLELFKRAIDEATALGAHLNLWGAEPLAHPHMAEILAYIGEKKTICTISTRGTLLADYAESIVDAGILEVLVSIDGPRQVYKLMSPSNTKYDDMEKGVKELVRVRKEKKSPVPVIGGRVFIALENYHYLNDMYIEMVEMGIDMATYTHTFSVSEGLGNTYGRFFLDTFNCPALSWELLKFPASGIEIAALSREIIRLKGKSGKIPVQFFPELKNWQVADFYKTSDYSAGIDRCMIPWFICNMLENGSVVTCVDYPDLSIGTIAEDPLMTLWNNEEMKHFRTELIRLGKFPICPKCSGLYRI
jgi:Fe-coproporphyrin III synthase